MIKINTIRPHAEKPLYFLVSKGGLLILRYTTRCARGSLQFFLRGMKHAKGGTGKRKRKRGRERVAS